MLSPYLNISAGIRLCIIMVASYSICGMNWKWYPCEDHKCLSTDRKRGILGYLVDINLLIIIQRESIYPVFVSMVGMSTLVLDWITSRKGFWRRTDFTNFLLLWSLFVLFFTGDSRTFRPPGKPISNLPYLFERVVKFHWLRIAFIYTCRAFNFTFSTIGPLFPR